MARLIRSGLSFSELTPAQLRSVAALLLALENLPRATPGVDLHLTLSQPNNDGNYGWASISVSDAEFRLAIGEHFYDPKIGGDTETHTLFESYPGTDQSAGSVRAWLPYVQARMTDGSSLIIEADNSEYDNLDWGDYEAGES